MLNKSDSITIPVSWDIVMQYYSMAKQKVEIEGWEERKPIKAKNFCIAWTSEHAFKEYLDSKNIWYEYAGQYVGAVENSPKEDFTLSLEGKLVRVGIRCRKHEDLNYFKEMTYPHDRLIFEKKDICDYVIAASVQSLPPGKNVKKERAEVYFWGAIKKDEFLDAYTDAPVKKSEGNKEQFRYISLEKFEMRKLEEILIFSRKNQSSL